MLTREQCADRDYKRRPQSARVVCPALSPVFGFGDRCRVASCRSNSSLDGSRIRVVGSRLAWCPC